MRGLVFDLPRRVQISSVLYCKNLTLILLSISKHSLPIDNALFEENVI